MPTRTHHPGPPLDSFDALVALLPAFETSTPDEFAHSEWEPILTQFHDTVYATGFMLDDFRWMDHVSEYERIVYHAPEEIDGMDLDGLRELTTGIVRGERFTGGLLPKLAHEGVLTRILRRTAAVVEG